MTIIPFPEISPEEIKEKAIDEELHWEIYMSLRSLYGRYDMAQLKEALAWWVNR